MPRKAANYQNGVQYKIVCKDPTITDCYNGSCCSFKDRKQNHKATSLNPNCIGYNFKVYQFIREHGGWDNWTFLQIEEYPCKSKQELVLRERHWFDIIKPTLNSYSPMTTPEEKKKSKVKYDVEKYTDNKAKIVAKVAQYQEEHRAEINAKRRERITCECGCVFSKNHLSIHKKTAKHLNLMNQLK